MTWYGMKVCAKNFLLSAVCTLLMVGCASESRGPSAGGGSGGSVCPAIGNLTVEFVQLFGGGQSCNVSGTLTENAVVQSGINYQLLGSLEIGDSNTAPTLTMQPGSQIQVSEPSQFIYVAPAARIIVNGSASNPVRLEPRESSNASVEGWGGLIIEDIGSQSVNINISYLVIANGGAPVERNDRQFASALTLIGDHDDTALLFVQAHASMMDGITLTSDGGNNTTNNALLENILVTNSARDGIVFNQFSGLIKNALVIHQQASGRAGIRGGGADSNPLIVSTTLVGNDDTSDLPPGNLEFAFIFEDDLDQVRIANTLVHAFRNGCYRVQDGADLSGLALAMPDFMMDMPLLMPDDAFVDGVHCVDPDFQGDQEAVLESVAAGLMSLPASLLGTDLGSAVEPGINFYRGDNSLFAGDFGNFEGEFTASWFFDQLTVNGAELSNGAALRRYNGGDTDNNGTPDEESDRTVNPLLGFDASFDEIYSGIPNRNLTCGLSDQFAPGVMVDLNDGSFNPIIIPAELDPVRLICGRIIAGGSLFDLTVIGAISDTEDTRFDDWPITSGLQRGI